MPKMKSNSGASKRFKKSGNGTFKRMQSHRRHILTKKTTKRKRQLRVGENRVSAVDTPMIQRLLPYA